MCSSGRYGGSGGRRRTGSGGWRRSEGSAATRPVAKGGEATGALVRPECGHPEGIETVVIDHVQRLGCLYISDLDATVFEAD